MMRWDGWMRGGLKSGLIVLALGAVPVFAQEKPAANPTTKATTKPAATPAAPEEEKSPAELLANAKKTYEQKNYQAAADQFRKLIKTYPSQPETPSARYGLALALAALPQPDYNALAEALTPTTAASFAEKPYALYYLGLAFRRQGLKDPATDKQKFEQAGQQFAAAAAGFAALPKTAATPGRELPVELDWSCRAKCDEADVLIRAG